MSLHLCEHPDHKPVAHTCNLGCPLCAALREIQSIRKENYANERLIEDLKDQLRQLGKYNE